MSEMELMSKTMDMTHAAMGSKAVTPANESAQVMGAIVRLASDATVDVEKMRALMEIWKSVQQTQAETAFHAAMAQLQPRLPRIEKHGAIMVKGQLRSKYAKYEDIDAAIRPLMAEYGFSISFNSEQEQNGVRMIGTLSHEQGHSKTISVRLPLDSNEYRTAIQSMGSTVSYGRRYLTCMLLNIITVDEDTDGNQVSRQISDEQVMQIETALKDTGADVQKFKEYMGVSKISDITEADFPRAKAALDQKRRSTR